jgi:hypothetical protein
MILVAACGHQVTPSPSTSDLSGDVVVKFRVNGTLDFNDYTYAIVIDTCGEGTPYPQVLFTTFNSYSYGFFIGAAYGVAQPQLIEYFVGPNSSGGLTSVKVPASSSLENFNPNDNGLGNEFELVFARAQLDNPLDQKQPCPNIPPSSSTPMPSSSPGPSPTVTATATPIASASPSPSPTPIPNPTTAAQAYWSFNFFVFQNITVLDSLGIGGPVDTTFNSGVINTNMTEDVPLFKATGGVEPGNPAAQINGGDIQNYQ